MATSNVIMTGAEEYPVFESFDDYQLSEKLLRGIYSHGFEKPSAIQQKAIQPILDGRDRSEFCHSADSFPDLFLTRLSLKQTVLCWLGDCRLITHMPI